MNIERSIDILNAHNEHTIQQLADYLKITRPWLRKMMDNNNPRHIGKTAEFYGISVSEFIKVGEDG